MSRLLDLLKTAERHRSERGARSAKTSDPVSGVSENAPAENSADVAGADNDIERARTRELAQYRTHGERRIAAERRQRPAAFSLEEVRALSQAAGARALLAQIEADKQHGAEARQREASERNAEAVEREKAQLERNALEQAKRRGAEARQREASERNAEAVEREKAQ